MRTQHDWDRSTEESLRAGSLALLRPGPAELDQEWMERTCMRIVADGRAACGPRRWKRLVAGATVVVAATGGVAAAAVSARPYLEHTWTQWFSRGAEQAVRPTVTMIADVRLPGNGRFTAWRATTPDEICSAAADNWDGAEKITSGGMGCGEIDPEAADRDRQLFDYSFAEDARGDWYHPVVYGAPADPRDDRVTQVRVHGRLFDGPDWQRNAVLDPATRGFGVVVPGARPRSSMEAEWDGAAGEALPWDSNLRSIVVDLLDDQDQVVRSITLLDVRPRSWSGRR